MPSLSEQPGDMATTRHETVSLDATRRALEPALRRVLHFYWRFARAMTLGVRALVIDGEGRIFLVKHSYVSGWHLPGGGVEAGETLVEALARELREEGNIELTAPPRLHGIFFNSRGFPTRPCCAVRGARLPPGGGAGARPRDRRARLLRLRRAARRYHGCDPRAHHRSARRRRGQRALVRRGGRNALVEWILTFAPHLAASPRSECQI